MKTQTNKQKRLAVSNNPNKAIRGAKVIQTNKVKNAREQMQLKVNRKTINLSITITNYHCLMT